MAIAVRCPYCSKQFTAPDSFAGRTVQCLACGGRVMVASKPPLEPIGGLDDLFDDLPLPVTPVRPPGAAQPPVGASHAPAGAHVPGAARPPAAARPKIAAFDDEDFAAAYGPAPQAVPSSRAGTAVTLPVPLFWASLRGHARRAAGPVDLGWQRRDDLFPFRADAARRLYGDLHGRGDADRRRPVPDQPHGDGSEPDRRDPFDLDSAVRNFLRLYELGAMPGAQQALVVGVALAVAGGFGLMHEMQSNDFLACVNPHPGRLKPPVQLTSPAAPEGPAATVPTSPPDAEPVPNNVPANPSPPPETVSTPPVPTLGPSPADAPPPLTMPPITCFRDYVSMTYLDLDRGRAGHGSRVDAVVSGHQAPALGVAVGHRHPQRPCPAPCGHRCPLRTFDVDRHGRRRVGYGPDRAVGGQARWGRGRIPTMFRLCRFRFTNRRRKSSCSSTPRGSISTAW